MFFQDNWGIGAFLEKVMDLNTCVWCWFKEQNMIVKAVTVGAAVIALWFIAKMISVILFGAVLVLGSVSYFKS